MIINTRRGKQPKRPIIYDGKQYESITAAAKATGIEISCLRWSACHNQLYKGVECRFVNDKPRNTVLADAMKAADLFAPVPETVIPKITRRIRSRQGVRVESATKSFKSIKAAAQYLCIKPHVLCHILRTAGQYVKDGEIYTAMDPARKMSPYTKNIITKAPEIIPQAVTGKSIARDLLKDRASVYIQQNQFGIAKELLDIIESISKD